MKIIFVGYFSIRLDYVQPYHKNSVPFETRAALSLHQNIQVQKKTKNKEREHKNKTTSRVVRL